MAASLRQFVLKVASRCDLGCDYCYVYRMADRSFARQPRFMNPATLAITADRIAAHAEAHGLRRVSVVLHGGEPLLAGPEYLATAARTIRRRVPADLQVQTHGGLLDDAMLAVLAEHDITVGVSLDGGAAHHDRHRRRADGRGSHEQTVRGLRRLTSERFRPLFAGLLCVVDTANDPVEVYDELAAFRPPAIDFLLPHGNWSRPPAPGAYGTWLRQAFDRWYDARPAQTTVRLFEDVIRLAAGGAARGEQVGLSPAAFVVVDTDGALQQVDTLKSVRAGAMGTGMHVRTHSMDEVLDHPEVRARRRGLDGLCATCRRCPIVTICGGGSYVHRYREDNGFDNPSVYCADLAALIRHVVDRLAGELGPGTSGQATASIGRPLRRGGGAARDRRSQTTNPQTTKPR
nr:FxsB family cyclophane-forming radical SAM/SPASM peptide maturase [uncultured Actinoplanes sp.]